MLANLEDSAVARGLEKVSFHSNPKERHTFYIKDIYLNAEFQRIKRRDKEVFLSDQCKEIEETIEWERLEISSRKLETPKDYFMQGWAESRTEMVL